jgi:hypothetical protein
MEINNDIDKIIHIFEKEDLLWDNNFEQELLKNRINISYDNFINTHKTVEKQYRRCLTYVNFNMENELDETINMKTLKKVNIRLILQ